MIAKNTVRGGSAKDCAYVVRKKAATQSGSTTLQARVPTAQAALITRDAELLGLVGTSDVIREALRLLHRKAELVALGRQYDDFYGDEPAPANDITAALYADE